MYAFHHLISCRSSVHAIWYGHMIHTRAACARQAVRMTFSGDGSLSELLGALQALEPEPWALHVPGGHETPAPASAQLLPSGEPQVAPANGHLPRQDPALRPGAVAEVQGSGTVAVASRGLVRVPRRGRWTSPEMTTSTTGEAIIALEWTWMPGLTL